VKNVDGSFDIYLAPKAPAGKEGKLAANGTSQELVHDPAHVWATGALDQ
jgi:hypothetical protein